MSEARDSTLARLRPLPMRLRIAHLAALLRHERAARAVSYPSPSERSLPYPSPGERELSSNGSNCGGRTG
jgi:hypothetical protein